MLRIVGWMACVLYGTVPSFWLLVHPRAGSWRSRARSPYFVLLPLWGGMWIVLATATLRWRHALVYHALWTWIPALGFFVTGLLLYRASGKQFSARQLIGIPEITAGQEEQRLVTTGLRSRMRHPIYLAHLCEMLAWSVGTGLAVCYGLTAFAIFTGAIMIHFEDEELEKRFGEPYRNYRQRVPAILPRF